MKNCGNWEFMRMKHDEFKFNMKYTKNYAYINYSLSYNWYSKYIEEKVRRCKCKNMIILMMMCYKLIYHEQEMIRKLIKKKFEWEKNYIKWLKKTWHIFKRKNINIFWLFNKIYRIYLWKI